MKEQLALLEKQVLDVERMSKGMMTNAAAEAMYSIALSFWKNKQYEKASDVYGLLFVFRPRNPKYLDAMARCAYDLGDYHRALTLYSYSGVCGGDLGRALLCTGKCHLALGEKKKARAMFDYIRQMAKKNHSFVSAHVLEEVNAFLKILKK